MAYYLQRGDYGGGYYGRRGDPGLLSVLGGLVKTGIGFATGGPAGAITALMPRAQVPALPPGPFMPGSGVQLKGPFGTGMAVGTFAGGGGMGAAAPVMTARGAACGLGYRPKLVYVRGEGAKRIGPCVRTRRMNPANPRALRRAVRREHAFVALARRTLRGTGLIIKRSGFGRKKAIRRR